MRSVVVLPAPSGPTRPKISPRADLEIQVIHGRQLAEAAGQIAQFAMMGGISCTHRISASTGMLISVRGWGCRRRS